MQAVAYLDENDTNVVAHGEKQLFEGLCLSRCLIAKDATTDLGNTIHDLCYLRSENILDILHGVVGILHHIVQECCAYAGATQSYLATNDLCHRQGVHNIWFARETAHSLMRLTCKFECFFYGSNLLAMWRCQIRFYEAIIGLLYHLVVFHKAGWLFYFQTYLLISHVSSVPL